MLALGDVECIPVGGGREGEREGEREGRGEGGREGGREGGGSSCYYNRGLGMSAQTLVAYLADNIPIQVHCM